MIWLEVGRRSGRRAPADHFLELRLAGQVLGEPLAVAIGGIGPVVLGIRRNPTSARQEQVRRGQGEANNATSRVQSSKRGEEDRWIFRERAFGNAEAPRPRGRARSTPGTLTAASKTRSTLDRGRKLGIGVHRGRSSGGAIGAPGDRRRAERPIRSATELIVSARAGRHKGPRHFVQFGRYENDHPDQRMHDRPRSGRHYAGISGLGRGPRYPCGVNHPSPRTRNLPGRPIAALDRVTATTTAGGASPPPRSRPKTPFVLGLDPPAPAGLGVSSFRFLISLYEAGVILAGRARRPMPSAPGPTPGSARGWPPWGSPTAGSSRPIGLVAGLVGWQAVDRRDWRISTRPLWSGWRSRACPGVWP